MTQLGRRTFLHGAGALGLSCLAPVPAEAKDAVASARPFPLSLVRLTPSPWLDAVNTNLRFLIWRCMGSAMEAHASHGDSIYWQGGDASAPVLYVNEYIPSTLDWPGVGSFELKTAYPHGDKVELVVTSAAGQSAIAVRLRLPGWSADAELAFNGRRLPAVGASGYATLNLQLRAGDRISLTLPMSLYKEAAPGDASVQAVV